MTITLPDGSKKKVSTSKARVERSTSHPVFEGLTDQEQSAVHNFVAKHWGDPSSDKSPQHDTVINLELDRETLAMFGCLRTGAPWLDSNSPYGLEVEGEATSQLVPNTSEDALEGPHLAFSLKEWVEYYSLASGTGTWTHGQLHGLDCLDEDGDLILYQVIAGPKRLLRRSIGMDQLRQPLEEGEPVSVNRNGEWVPATICGGCPISLHLRRYDVRVESTNEELLRLSGALLRRRYIPGAEVVVYRGPALGWCNAVVVEEGEDLAWPVRPEVKRDCDIPEWPLVAIRLEPTVKTPIGPEMQVPAYLLSKKALFKPDDPVPHSKADPLEVELEI